ncbi:MAG: hypothetical protein DRJ42_20610 [Deltaproteobacteria bacterium]|nr:MAG: hypothetical protein DRJ42_20610 [Deltaproteobacteria bacterium]
MRHLALTLLTAVFFISAPASAQDVPADAPPDTTEGPRPRYLAAIETELEALSIPHSCEAVSEIRAHCAFPYRGRSTEREFDVHLVYSDDTDTIYFYVARLATALPDASTTPALLRRLMELNWSLLVAKLEWNAADGEVRLSMIQNTDSNFDRRAFRGLVRRIGSLADRYARELDRLSSAD